MPKPRGAQDGHQYCVATVEGTSLRDAGINDGDEAVIRTSFDPAEVRQGQLLAVNTPHGLLLKFVYWTLTREVRLVSANPEYEDLLLDAELVEVQGVVEYTLRHWR